VKRATLILIFLSIIFNYSFAQTDTVITEKSKNKVIIGGKGYYVHIVKKSETLFSLSKVYNVSQKDIAKENPEIFLGLQIGQALKIPIVEDKSNKDKILSNDYIYHRVKKGQTLYSLSRKYNVSQDDIMACNPTVRYGINVDQIVKIPKSTDVVQALRSPVNDNMKDTIKIIDKYIYHIVKKNETIYSLTRFYEITEDILLEHNPLISEGLKLGQVLKVPRVEDIESSIVIKQEEQLTDTVLYKERSSVAYSDSAYLPGCEEINIKQTEPYKVALLLPLYLDKNDEEFYIDSSEVDDFGKKIYEKILFDPYYIYPRSVPFVEFYQGFMLAVDSLKQRGLSVNLHVFDTQNDTAKIKEILGSPEFVNTDLIIGPIFNSEIKLVSEFSKENQIKMISPLSDNLNLIKENPYIFQVKPSYNSQIDKFAKFVSNFGDKNIVLVHNGDSLGYSNVQMVKDKIFNNLSVDTLVNYIQFKEVVFEDSINVLEHSLNNELENVFIIPSNDEAFVTDVLTNLNTLKMFGHSIRVIGLSRWPRFENIDPEYYFNLELCIATPFFIDFHHMDVKDFILKFRDIYSTEPNQMAIHAYDVGLYFLSALLNYGEDFEKCIYNHKVDMLQADYHFVKWYEYSGFENTNVDIIKYYDGYNIFRIDDFKKEIDTLSQSDEF
jgi:LysM repeat protein